VAGASKSGRARHYSAMLGAGDAAMSRSVPLSGLRQPRRFGPSTSQLGKARLIGASQRWNDSGVMTGRQMGVGGACADARSHACRPCRPPCLSGEYRAQDGRHRCAAPRAIDVHRCKAGLVVMHVSGRKLLAAIRRAGHVVDVEGLRPSRLYSLAEPIKERDHELRCLDFARRVLEAADGRLRRSGAGFVPTVSITSVSSW
jgi:hypothetical protein